MNVFLKELIILIVGILVISVVTCDDTIELTCTSDEDCRSFENKFISSRCSSDSSCICSDRKTANSFDCSPKVVKISNDDIKAQPCTAPNTEYNVKNGTCRTRNVHLGKSCEESVQCERNDWNSECLKGVCSCKNHFMDVDSVCRSIIEIEKCTSNDQCKENSECIKDKCICNKEFVSSSNYTKCFPFASYNETCFEDLQCAMKIGFGSVCKNSTCQCKSNYSVDKKGGNVSCLKNAVVGDSCVHNSDCFNDNLKLSCIENKCTCMIGFDTYNVLGLETCERDNVRQDSQTSAAASIKVFNLFSFVIFFAVVFALI